jgi:hypothetical protein
MFNSTWPIYSIHSRNTLSPSEYQILNHWYSTRKSSFQENVPIDDAGPAASRICVSPSHFLRKRGGVGDCLHTACNFGAWYAFSEFLYTFPIKNNAQTGRIPQAGESALLLTSLKLRSRSAFELPSSGNLVLPRTYIQSNFLQLNFLNRFSQLHFLPIFTLLHTHQYRNSNTTTHTPSTFDLSI